jgi:hypothetical protein
MKSDTGAAQLARQQKRAEPKRRPRLRPVSVIVDRGPLKVRTVHFDLWGVEKHFRPGQEIISGWADTQNFVPAQ